MLASSPLVRFRSQLERAQEFFAAESAAVSINTDEFGTIHRNQVAFLLVLVGRKLEGAAEGAALLAGEG